MITGKTICNLSHFITAMPKSVLATPGSFSTLIPHLYVFVHGVLSAWNPPVLLAPQSASSGSFSSESPS